MKLKNDVKTKKDIWGIRVAYNFIQNRWLSFKRWLKSLTVLLSFAWLIWEFSGVRTIISKVIPEKDSHEKSKKPVTILLWLVGIYVAFFTLTSQKYENRIDIIENRINAITTQLSTQAWRSAIDRISRTQNMLCPVKPEVLNIASTFKSFLGSAGVYSDGVEQLKWIIEDWKDSLSQRHIAYALLDSCNFQNANLASANLNNVNLSFSNLKGANLSHADLRNANLVGAILDDANLKDANLRHANLEKASLCNTILDGCVLTDASLINAKLVRSKLTGSILKSTIATKADMRYSILIGAQLSDASFKFADLTECNLTNAEAENADFTCAILAQAKLINLKGIKSVFTSSDLSGADMSQAELSFALFKEAIFIEAIIDNAILVSCDFTKVDGLSQFQLCKSKTLLNALLPSNVKVQVNENCPDRFFTKKNPETLEWYVDN